MSMVRRLRVVILIALPLFLGLGIVAARSAAAASLGCAGPADSAFNQYCEPVPTATGGKSPGPGTPAVANTLPPQVIRSIAGGAPVTAATTFVHPTARKRLLSVPAPTPSLRITQSAVANPWSLAWWMIVLLVAIALALTAAAIERRRRRRADGTAAPPPA